jgi:hypothetical protein
LAPISWVVVERLVDCCHIVEASLQYFMTIGEVFYISPVAVWEEGMKSCEDWQPSSQSLIDDEAADGIVPQL